MSYERIRLEDREEIFRLRYLEKMTLEDIGREVGKHKSSISRELSRGTRNKIYNPLTGEAAMRRGRITQCPKLKMAEEAWKIVKPQMEKRWSPEEIAEWLKMWYPEYPMSAKTIYNYVHFHMKGELKKVALSELRQKGKKRRKGTDKAEKRGKITEMTLIDERPAEISKRVDPGHWEGDLIIGKNHKSAILVTVERKSRFTQMDLLLKYDAVTVRKTIERRFKKLEPGLVKSVTFDQGKENSEHKVLAERAKIKVYFCHPHSPWEKGTCENTNYLIRDMLNGIVDFRELNQRRVSQIAQDLNDRPRKTLGFRTPKEVLLSCVRNY